MVLFKKTTTDLNFAETAREAITHADAFNYTNPEETTFRLRHAINHLPEPETDLAQANLYAELMFRNALLTSDLRRQELDHEQYHDWLSAVSSGIGGVKSVLKRALRQPWRNHYDWLGQSLSNSTAMENAGLRRAYEQLAIAYRIQQHLLDYPNRPVDIPTTKSGYQIEKVMRTGDQIANKANRLIGFYHSPQIKH